MTLRPPLTPARCDGYQVTVCYLAIGRTGVRSESLDLDLRSLPTTEIQGLVAVHSSLTLAVLA